MLHGTAVDACPMGSPGRQGNSSVGGDLQQAAPIALVANSPPRAPAAIREIIETKVAAYRQRAENAERDRQMVIDQKAQLQLAFDKLGNELAEKTNLLASAKVINEGMKRRVQALQDASDKHAWADEPVRGKKALDVLFPDGIGAEPLRAMGIMARWSPGILRALFMANMEDVCACRREMAANGLKNPKERFEDVNVLGVGGFGVVRRGRCKKTRKQYAIKMTKKGKEEKHLVREMAAYAILKNHKNIIEVEALSDIAGSEGIVMELAICDLFQASVGQSETRFTLSQLIGFEADATEGLRFMHGAGIIHCDHKLQNVLICRSGGPMGFVGKLTDPAVWYGVGEMRTIKTGTMGWCPLENAHVEVEAAPAQDTFAVGVDLCFIVGHPDVMDGVVNMFSHPKLMTPEETARLQALRAEGGDLAKLEVEIVLRTMADGSLPRIFLQPNNLNPALPAAVSLKTCEMLRQIVSGNPMDRPSMPVVTAFLRDLEGKTAAREESRALVPRGSAPPLDMAVPVAPLVVAPHAKGEEHGAGAAVLPAEAVKVPRGPTPNGFAPPSPAAGPVALPVVLEVVAPHEEGQEGNAGAAVPVVGPIGAPHGSAPRGSAPPTVQAEAANVDNPSMERGHLGLPPVVEPHTEGGRDGVRAELPPPDAIRAPADSGPPAAASPAEGEATDADMACLKEIRERVDLLIRPFPRTPVEALANHMADNLRTLGCPSPSASSPLAGETYRGDVGGGSGSGGSGGVGIGGTGDGNGEGSGGSGNDSGSVGGGRGAGRTMAGGGSRGALPAVTGVKGRRPLTTGSRSSWVPACSFLKRFW